eukprot:7605662-Pyramimonas_sp.AAC.1
MRRRTRAKVHPALANNTATQPPVRSPPTTRPHLKDWRRMGLPVLLREIPASSRHRPPTRATGAQVRTLLSAPPSPPP